MPKPTNKAIIMTVAATIIGAGAGSGVTYLVMHHQNSRDIAIRNSGPESADFTNVPTPKQDSALPAGTISPSTIATQPQTYADKDIKVRGRIVESGTNQYSIVGQEVDKPLGLRLDFSKSNVDPKTYTSPAIGTKVDGNKPPMLDPVTVSGKLVKAEANGFTTYSLVVTSVEK